MKNLLFILVSILLISCAGAKLATPTMTDVEYGKQKYPDLTLTDVNIGKANFEKSCSQCHSLKKPGSKSPEQWEKTVPRMAAKAEKKEGKEKIDEATQKSILMYLSAVTRKK